MLAPGPQVRAPRGPVLAEGRGDVDGDQQGAATDEHALREARPPSQPAEHRVVRVVLGGPADGSVCTIPESPDGGLEALDVERARHQVGLPTPVDAAAPRPDVVVE